MGQTLVAPDKDEENTENCTCTETKKGTLSSEELKGQCHDKVDDRKTLKSTCCPHLWPILPF